MAVSAKKHAVLRTDLMSGTNVFSDLCSFRFYGADDQPAEVENGTIVHLEELEEGEREVWKAKAATTGDSLLECVIAAGVELMYDERYRDLADYTNEAGRITRGYALRSRNIFSVTPEGFENPEELPDVGETVGIGKDGKLKKGGTEIGKCIHKETVGKYQYIAIQIGGCETPASGMD